MKATLILAIIFNLINIIISIPFLSRSLSYLSSPLIKSIVNKKKVNISSLFNDDNNDNISQSEEEEKDSFRGRLFNILREEFLDMKINETNITKGCKNVFYRYLLGYNDTSNSSNVSYLRSDYHLVKLLDDSSKSRNYLATYDQCMKKKYRFNIPDNQISNETRSTYVILRLDKTNNLFDYNKTNLAINSLETEFYYY